MGNMLVLDQTPSCRYFYFDVWFSNFNWFSEMSLLLTGSIIFGNILWIITADLFKPKVEQIFSIKYNLLKILPSTSSSFVQCLTVNVLMICKSYKVLAKKANMWKHFMFCRNGSSVIWLWALLATCLSNKSQYEHFLGHFP